MTDGNNKPEKVIAFGAVRAAIFSNTIQKNGQTIRIPKVLIERTYKDKDGEFKKTSSYGVNDLPKLQLAAQRAFEFLTEKGNDKGEE